MLDIYLITLALSLAIGVGSTLVLLALSRTERFLTLFHIRGALEKPRWGGVVFIATFALTPFIASALSSHASEFFSPKSGSFLGLLAAAALVFLVGFFDDVKLTSPALRSLVFQSAAAQSKASARARTNPTSRPEIRAQTAQRRSRSAIRKSNSDGESNATSRLGRSCPCWPDSF